MTSVRSFSGIAPVCTTTSCDGGAFLVIPAAAICARCRLTKPTNAFPPDARKKNKRCSHCLACRAADSRARYARKRDIILAKKVLKRKTDPAKALEQDRRDRQAGIANRRARNKEVYSANPEKAKAAVRLWRLENPERARLSTNKARALWRKKNPRLYKEAAERATQARRARKALAEFEPITLGDIVQRDGKNCYICGIETALGAPAGQLNRAEIEHVISLARGGSHTAANLRCCCLRCNRIKGANRTPDETRAIVAGGAIPVKPMRCVGGGK